LNAQRYASAPNGVDRGHLWRAVLEAGRATRPRLARSARPPAAQTRSSHCRADSRVGRRDDRQRASDLLGTTRTTAAPLGLRALIGDVNEVGAKAQGWPIGAPRCRRDARMPIWRTDEGPGAVVRAERSVGAAATHIDSGAGQRRPGRNLRVSQSMSQRMFDPRRCRPPDFGASIICSTLGIGRRIGYRCVDRGPARCGREHRTDGSGAATPDRDQQVPRILTLRGLQSRAEPVR